MLETYRQHEITHFSKIFIKKKCQEETNWGFQTRMEADMNATFEGTFYEDVMADVTTLLFQIYCLEDNDRQKGM